MKRFLFLSLLLASGMMAVAQDKLYNDEFPLGDVTLLDGPLQKARDLNIKTLLQYDCDRLLAPYRKEAGLTPKKPTYPNWDGLDGHVGRQPQQSWRWPRRWRRSRRPVHQDDACLRPFSLRIFQYLSLDGLTHGDHA